MPRRALRLGSFMNALAAGIAERRFFVTVQQRPGHVEIVDVGRRARHGVHQARPSVHADVRLHTEVPVVALLRLLHLRVAFTLGVLGRARRGDQRGIDRRPGAHEQALNAQQVVDDAQHVHRQVVPLQQVAKPKDGGLVGQPVQRAVELGELTVQRHVVQRLFHRGVRQAEPLLKVVNAQHRRDCEGRTTGLRARAMRLDDLHQPIPRNHAFHLVQKLALARLLGRQVQPESELLQGVLPVAAHGLNSCKLRACFADFH